MRQLRFLGVSLLFLAIAGLAAVRLVAPKVANAQSPTSVFCPDNTAAPHGDAALCGKCDDNGFLGLISWHHYLQKKDDCSVNLHLVVHVDKGVDACQDDGGCDYAQTDRLNALWLIGVAVFEDLLRIAGLVAVGFIIYGGIRYISSDGQPETIKQAHATLINALIGLGIAIVGATLVAFIGNKLGGS